MIVRLVYILLPFIFTVLFHFLSEECANASASVIEEDLYRRTGASRNLCIERSIFLRRKITMKVKEKMYTHAAVVHYLSVGQFLSGQRHVTSGHDDMMPQGGSCGDAMFFFFKFRPL